MEREERERIRQAHLQEEEQLVESGIYQLFVNAEIALVDSSDNLTRRIRTELPSMHLPGAREFISRTKFEATRGFVQGNEQLTQAYVDKLFSILPHLTPEKKQLILQKALLEAGDFWEKTLENPDNPADLIMIGRARLTKINEKLEAISDKE